MSKPRTKELLLGLFLTVIGIPSKGGITRMICDETLCNPSFQNDVFNGCWYCTLISIIFLIVGIGLIVNSINEWN